MDERPISPWAERAERASPDGAHRAFFAGLEVGMGAPTLGALRVEGPGGGARTVCEAAGASFVWSSDSRRLAFARWGEDERTGRVSLQRLCVFHVDGGRIDESPYEFAVLELSSFEGWTIEGVASPALRPAPIAVAHHPEDGTFGPAP